MVLLFCTSETGYMPAPHATPYSLTLVFQAWPKHKRLCKIYQNPSPPSADTYCGLCGKTDNLTRTECCDRAICDDEGSYQMFSYSGVCCSRNHRRYTLCGYHHGEGHQEKDWKKCEKCVGGDLLNLTTAITQGTSELPFLIPIISLM